ncbi:MAG: A/G-specific adenine glycosylase [Anaerolineales bacterium]|nr:A/G-specific adenine glycosylase [Anaerolineales bacterium]
MLSFITSNLLEWYSCHARPLPWRENPTPYKVLVSEVMAQQTQVNTIIPYFERWIERFPTITDLANASLQDVLSIWEGLGYYQRARHLHQAAQKIMSEYGGEIPSNIKDLLSLPGIGRYSAGAIASIAFGLDEPALDGNIRRVLSRVFDISEPINTTRVEKRLQQLAADHLPTRMAGTYNQALMELGALVCTPKSPECAQCPLAQFCQARLLGVQNERPVKQIRSTVPHYTVTAAVIKQKDKVLIAQRPLRGLLGGMWEFPGGKQHESESLDACLTREIQEELGVTIKVGDSLGVYRHAYSHFRVTLHAFICALTNGDQPQPIQAENICWSKISELSNYPMGKIDRQIAKKLMENIHDHR